MRTRLGFLLIAALTISSFSVVWASDRAIVLTFDDGPRKEIKEAGQKISVLPKLMELLKEENIKAAFFIQCWQAEENEENKNLVRRAYQERHEIANHTYGHTLISEWLPKKGKHWILNDIERCSQTISKITGQRPLFFRPRSWVIDEKYKTGWHIDPKNPLKTLCGENFPDNRLFKEELVCRGYLVQVLDDPKIFDALLKEVRDDPKMRELYQRDRRASLNALKERAAKMREVRDVNTTDYDLYELYKKNNEEAVAKLLSRVRQAIKEREKAGVKVHILAFHELPVTVAALKILIPELKKSGYQFQTLRWAWGI